MLIDKANEPPCLADARRTAKVPTGVISGEDWPSALGPDCNQTLLNALHKEQRGLCAYCWSRITPSTATQEHPERGGMTVEHWVPRSGYEGDSDGEKVKAGTKALDWANLLGVCVGVVVVGDSKADHCDKSRGNKRLYRHPAKPSNVLGRFRINSADGTLTAIDDDPSHDSNDIKILNLNLGRLKENRRKAIEQTRERIKKDASRQSFLHLWRTATTPDKNGRLPAYAPARCLYLYKKMRARGLLSSGDNPVLVSP